MYERSDEVAARIFRRDAEERAGMGGVDAWVSGEVIGVPTGEVWPRNSQPGPLDGQPRMRWHYTAAYASGRSVIYKAMV
jgi:hypothetical protein